MYIHFIQQATPMTCPSLTEPPPAPSPCSMKLQPDGRTPTGLCPGMPSSAAPGQPDTAVQLDSSLAAFTQAAKSPSACSSPAAPGQPRHAGSREGGARSGPPEPAHHPLDPRGPGGGGGSFRGARFGGGGRGPGRTVGPLGQIRAAPAAGRFCQARGGCCVRGPQMPRLLRTGARPLGTGRWLAWAARLLV